MITKTTVKLDGLRHEMFHVCGMVDAAFIEIAVKPAVLTSALDSHADRPTSLHIKGLACDFRTRHISITHAQEILAWLKVHLDPLGYDSILESDHLHVEFQPKGNECLFRCEGNA